MSATEKVNNTGIVKLHIWDTVMYLCLSIIFEVADHAICIVFRPTTNPPCSGLLVKLPLASRDGDISFCLFVYCLCNM